jgi:lipid-A-disaccharide synthase
VQAFLRHADGYRAAYRKTRDYFRDVRPALAILVDNPGNNLRLLSLARRYRIPVLYYIPPEMWSIWPWEVRAIVDNATAIAPVFRSEGEVYRAWGGRVCCVGHPLIDLLGNRPKSKPVVAGSPDQPQNGDQRKGCLPVARAWRSVI